MHREKLSKSFLKRFEVKKNPNVETEILKQITKQFKTLGSLDPENRKEFASNFWEYKFN